MTFDPHEMTTRDPMEETVPDPVGGRRIGGLRRRVIEACALLVLAPTLLVVDWVDHERQAVHYEPKEIVTLVPRGAAGKLGQIQVRLAGRDATAQTAASNGAARLTLVVEVRPLDAQAAKDARFLAYSVRDRAGHTWSAAGLPTGGRDPVAGQTAQVKVSASVPPSSLNAVVLEVRGGGASARTPGKVRVLRFAH